jgi:predicted NUDIX family NTP pyrophosphohydrolase
MSEQDGVDLGGGERERGARRRVRAEPLSAGILLHRATPAGPEVLLAHPGGPWFARKDAGAWTIPKGEPDPGEVMDQAPGPPVGMPGAAAEGSPDRPANEDPGPPSAAGTGGWLLAVALREFAEETGHPAPPGPVADLGTIVQVGGKVVHAWAVQGDLNPATARSNTFELEWPPHSGRRASFPEVDRVAWFTMAEARRRIRPAQAPFVDRLAAALELAP